MRNRVELTATSLLARLIAEHGGPNPAACVRAGRPGPEVAAGQWPLLLAEARRQQVEPLLAAALGTPDAIVPPPEVRATLAASTRRVQITNLLMLDALATVLEALNREGIPTLLLKGTALALTLYRTPALRPLGDIDLLVHPEDAERAAAALAERGYMPGANPFTGRALANFGERSFVRSGRSPLVVDLHWQLLARASVRRGMDLNWFLAQTSPLELQGAQTTVLTPTAQLLHLCAHCWEHGRPTLRWSYDIALLMAQQTINWEVALTAAQRFGLGLALKRSLAAVVQWWGIAPPLAYAAQVAALPTSLIAGLFDRCAATGNWRGLAVVEGLAQPTPQAATTYWLQLLFPPVAYMRRSYAVQGWRELAACYTRRLGHGLLGMRKVRRAGQAANAEGGARVA